MPDLVDELQSIKDLPWLQETKVITVLTDLLTPKQFGNREVIKLICTPLNSFEALKLVREAQEHAIWNSDLAAFLSRSLSMKIEANLHKASTLEIRFGYRLILIEVFGDIRQEKAFQLKWWLVTIDETKK